MKTLLMAAVICALLAFGASAAIDGVLFQASAHYNVAFEPYRIAIADFNGDNINDMACAHYTGDSIAVLIGKGGGDYQPAAFYTIGTYQYDIQAANIDGDADIELLVATGNNVYTLDNNGDGTFATAAQVSGLVNSPQTIRLALVDGDADLDLIVAHNDGSYTDLSVWENDGSGNFTFDNSYTVGTSQSVMAVADFDGTNGPDIAVGTAAPNWRVLLNDGSGGYTVGSPSLLASAPRGMCAADFDGGGDIEIVITLYQALTLYTNDGSGNFSTGGGVGTLGNGYCPTASDFDGANGPDIVISDDSTYVYFNNGSGAFTGVNVYWVGEYSEGLAVGDLDNDGNDDLAVVGRAGSSDDAGDYIAVMLNPNGNGQFLYPIQTGTGPYWNGPVSLCRSDFDNDGNMDVATLDWVNDSVLVYLGDGMGHFTSVYRWGTLNSPCEIVAMDVDGQPGDDLIVGYSDVAGTSISVYHGVGGGLFAPPLTYPAGTRPVGIFVQDLNNDGSNDIATVNWTGQTISVLFNNGNGTFQPPANYATATAVNHSAIDGGDFDNNGWVDLVVPNGSANCTEVFYNNGGTFAPGVPVGGGTMYDPYQVCVDDLDNDGFPDIIAGSYDTHEVCVIMNNGGTGFHPDAYFYAGNEQYEIGVSDFDADGAKDIVVLNTESYSFSILFGDGLGGFAPAKHYGITSDDSEGLAIADFDGDTYPDVAVSNYNHDNISVFPNRLLAVDVVEPWVVDNLPGQYGLSQNYPNPFNPFTTIQYNLPSKADVTITVYNLLGQRVRLFQEGVRPAGTHQVVWDGRTDSGQPVSTGIYFYQLKAGDYLEAKKMLLLK
ncbi:MAG: VCBS repeat-containing protein [Candidatus Zixiibacteriota bacterium]|nr:MAG: VCBS repeat-containing protein [candidate division Zixibacteria bacterium]